MKLVKLKVYSSESINNEITGGGGGHDQINNKLEIKHESTRDLFPHFNFHLKSLNIIHLLKF